MTYSCHQARFLGAGYAKIAFATGALPRTPLGELTALPRPIAGKEDGPHGGKGIGWSERKKEGSEGLERKWAGKGKGRGGKGEGREEREEEWGR